MENYGHRVVVHRNDGTAKEVRAWRPSHMGDGGFVVVEEAVCSADGFPLFFERKDMSGNLIVRLEWEAGTHALVSCTIGEIK